MRKRTYHLLRGIALIFFVLGSMGITALVVMNKTGRFDAGVIHSIQQNRSPAMQVIMTVCSDFGSAVFVLLFIILASLWLLKKKAFRTLKTFLLINLTAYLTELSLKLIVHRQRPVSWMHITVDEYSFPSGHSIMSFVMWIQFLIILRSLGYKSRWIYTLVSVVVIGVGIARIYLGVHWPSDVVGSWFIGSAIITAFSLKHDS